MSILNNPQTPEVSPAARAAQQLKQQARMTFQQMTQAFNLGAQTFWKNPRCTPQEIAAELGTDAKEVFELHGKLGSLLAGVNADAIKPGTDAVGQFTVNQDGTVTVPSAN